MDFSLISIYNNEHLFSRAHKLMSYLPWILPSASASLLCLFMAALIWERRKLPVAKAFYLFLFFVFIWVFSRFIITLLDDYNSRLLISKFQYIGIALTPLTWLIFSLTAIRKTEYLKTRYTALLSVIPLITIMLAATNDSHHLLWKTIDFTQFSIITEHGAWFPVHIIYSYILITIATLSAAIQYLRHPKYKQELIAIIISPLLVLFANFNNLADLIDTHNLDIVSLSFVFSILMFAWVVLKGHYLQLAPIARTILIENMQDAIVVLDIDQHVIDLNPSAIKLLRKQKSDIYGELFSRVLRDKDISKKIVENSHTELLLNNTYLQALNTRISALSREAEGFLIVFRDISELKSTQEKLEKAKNELQKANKALQIMANTDHLTQLPNRRYFLEKFSLEVARKNRHDSPLSMLILDLDHFKSINDTYGHTAGDEVLRRVSSIIKDSVREYDIAGRLGGEEFGLILPDTDIEGAKNYAERLRKNIQTSHNENEIPITASIGLTEAKKEMSVEQIIEAADTALYHSKETGRNKVTVDH